MYIPKTVAQLLSITSEHATKSDKNLQPETTPDVDPLLTVPEVSRWLRVKESTVRKWVCYQRIPYLKIGRSVAFSKEHIEAWLKENNPGSERWSNQNKVEKSYNEAVR